MESPRFISPEINSKERIAQQVSQEGQERMIKHKANLLYPKGNKAKSSQPADLVERAAKTADLVAGQPASHRQRAHTTARVVNMFHRMAASVLPPEYLARNQVEPERAKKIKAAAQARREQRNARRLAHANRVGR